MLEYAMPDSDDIQRALYGARCTLGEWQRRLGRMVDRKLLLGDATDKREADIVQQHISYWEAEIRRLEEQQSQRPAEWESW